ncbi:family 43 glycosylhydrolase [Paenibacillus whitsoniae]|uniref:1,4-beta-xylanase n=1 Tax=Paenibacillus whitsoniae TaxID=2496558 RepID=A0A430JDR0_9BACL|nr:family 43 glycosylhydrolase [Paenibacillus whitsoniae]RTE09193.1 1,4-beta-xylanase [Paenibacillus whitsoniae]
MKFICNPINMEYKYQYIDMGKMMINREAADPSLILFKDKYYLFPSMTAGFLISDNLADWEFHPLKDVPIYDYAPDVRVIGEYMYFSASSKSDSCSFFRTKDPVRGEFEEIPGSFPFWDPNLFIDDDGRVYFYWGCSNITPLYGVELNPEDMQPKGKPAELIYSNTTLHGFERNGEHHVINRTPEQIEEMVQTYAKLLNLPEEKMALIRAALSNSDPYIEGAWMDKYNGTYYLQYSSPGTQYNVYSDGVYVSDNPLGPFTLAKNNPYSYKPGGFMPGAGHGSTLEDKYGNWWHASTMRISVNHIFERRLGLWPAGFDQDGELFCNQRYGDWPMKIEQVAMNPWSDPEWMLLSYGKPAKASSCEEGKEASKATNENVQSWWKAATNASGEWLEVDLKHVCDVHAVQLNFADDQMNLPLPEGATLKQVGETRRYLDERQHVTRWLLEGSVDGIEYFVIEDKSEADTDLSHDLVVKEGGVKARYIRCTVKELPFNQNACISGLRVFGNGEGELPRIVNGVQTKLLSELDLSVTWEDGDAVGYNVLWGFAPDKLYHSYMVFGRNQVDIGALIKGQSVYVRVDAFNEKGITEGGIFTVIE